MHGSLKGQIRAELFRCAFAGQFPTYAQFYQRLRPGKKMGQFPWRTHFDEIAREERKSGYPDITFIVRGENGYPSQIDFRSAKPKPDARQLENLRQGTIVLIALYCPTATNPY